MLRPGHRHSNTRINFFDPQKRDPLCWYWLVAGHHLWNAIEISWLNTECKNTRCKSTSLTVLSAVGLAAVQGQYPVIIEDASQMAALQIHAEFGATLLGDEDGFESAIEQFITNEVFSLPTKYKQYSIMCSNTCLMRSGAKNSDATLRGCVQHRIRFRGSLAATVSAKV